MNLNKIIVSDDAFQSNDPRSIISSNIDIINLLIEQEGVFLENIYEGALTSYYIDYYYHLYDNGNFSDFFCTSQWNSKVNEIIKKGLLEVGAKKHLDFFLLQSRKVEQLSPEKRSYFLESPDDEAIEYLNDDSFFDIDENLIRLNSKWVRNHPHLHIISKNNLHVELQSITGIKINQIPPDPFRAFR